MFSTMSLSIAGPYECNTTPMKNTREHVEGTTLIAPQSVDENDGN